MFYGPCCSDLCCVTGCVGVTPDLGHPGESLCSTGEEVLEVSLVKVLGMEGPACLGGIWYIPAAVLWAEPCYDGGATALCCLAVGLDQAPSNLPGFIGSWTGLG